MSSDDEASLPPVRASGERPISPMSAMPTFARNVLSSFILGLAQGAYQKYSNHPLIVSALTHRAEPINFENKA